MAKRRNKRPVPFQARESARASGEVVAPSRRRIALLLFLVLFAIYVGNFRLRGAGDSFPVRVLPFSILSEGNLDLDEFVWEKSPQRSWPYYIHKQGKHFYSVSPIATSLVITPLYVLPTAWLAANDIPYDDARALVLFVAMERISAASLTALAAALLFLVLCRLTTWQAALVLSLVYGLGTSTWAISSQALWPHALSQLGLTVLCAVFLHPSAPGWAFALAGVTAAATVANRPQMIIFAALAGVYVLLHERRRLVAFIVLPLVMAGLLVSYNLSALGQISGGYGGFEHFTAPLTEGIGGLLFSPNRGLLIFTPIAIFAFWGAVRVWRCEAPLWMRYLTVGLLLHILLFGKFKEWWAGYTYGPRYFTDVWPALLLLLVYGLVPYWRHSAVRVVAIALAVYGVVVQAIGVYAADDSWNRWPVPLEQSPQRVWDWNDLQITRALGNGWRGFELLPVIVDALTDTVPARLTELDSADLAAQIEIDDVPQRIRAGQTSSLRVRVTNRGGRPWPVFSGKGLVTVRYLTFVVQQWMKGGRPLAGVGEVVLLPQNLEPGESAEVEMPFAAPQRRGTYEVSITVSQAVDAVRGIPSPNVVSFEVRVE